MQDGRRIVSIDLLRLVAAFQMVQGHTLAALLTTSARHGPVYATWLGLRGLTAVAFLLASGLAFHAATLRDLEAHRRDRGRVQQRFARALGLIALGYLLRLPVPLVAGAWRDAFAVDVLQCVGVCLALCESLVLLAPSRRAAELACASLGLALLSASAFASHIEARGAWLPLLDYVTATGGSLFPLMPWGAHMLLGVGLAPLFLGNVTGRWRPVLFILGWLVGAAWLGRGTPSLAFDHARRLAFVLAGFSALRMLEPAARRLPSWVLRLSSSTLLIYVSHVWPLYGRRFGLSSSIGPTLPVQTAVAVAVLLMAISTASVFVYDRLTTALAPRTATG